MPDQIAGSQPTARTSPWTSPWAPIAGVAVGLVPIVFYAIAQKHVTVFASASMLAAAAASVGALLGFLFGVPRANSGTQATEPKLSVEPAYRPNTNLEQISDWLTKILVGVGLTQIGPLAEAAGALVQGVSPALGGGAASAAFGAALLTYFTVAGFLAGWLVTRLKLPTALSNIERALETFHKADVAEQAGNPARAQELRAEGQRILGDAQRLGLIRDLLPQGAARRAATQEAVARARQQAEDGLWTVPEVCRFFDNSKTSTERILSLGLMQGLPAADYLTRVLEALVQPRTDAEQFHALEAARPLAPVLDPDRRTQLRAAVQNLIDAGRIPNTGARADTARALLADVPTVGAPPGPDGVPGTTPPPVVQPPQGGP